MTASYGYLTSQLTRSAVNKYTIATDTLDDLLMDKEVEREMSF